MGFGGGEEVGWRSQDRRLACLKLVGAVVSMAWRIIFLPTLPFVLFRMWRGEWQRDPMHAKVVSYQPYSANLLFFWNADTQ